MPTPQQGKIIVNGIEYGGTNQIDDTTKSGGTTWSSTKIYDELASKAEIDDTAVNSSTAWSSSQIVSLLPTESASGAVANFETPLTLPLVSHNVTIEPVQVGTGDPSPSNVRPISGWNAVNVTRTGSNIWDEEWELGSISTVDGSKSASDSVIRTKNNIYVKSNTKFSIVKRKGFPFYILFYDTNGVAIQYVQQAGDVAAFNMSAVIDENATSATFTTPNGTAYILIRFNRMTSYSGGISVNYPATDTTYHAYSSGNTYEIDLDDTTYAGELNVKTGEGSITHTIYDMSALSWNKNGSTPTFYSGIIQGIKEQTADFYCTCYLPTVNGGYNAQNLKCSLRGETGQTRIWVCDNSFETPADFIASLTNQKVVLPKASPTPFNFNPITLSSLSGVNNIWADTGDTAVEFKQDIQTYIDSRLSSGTRSLSLAKAPVETEETKQEEQEGDENVDR